jgi:hypothetical protein
MRVCLLLLFLLISNINSFAQQSKKKDTCCNYSKHPCVAQIGSNKVAIDTISSKKFDSILVSLNSKIINKQSLTKEDDRCLIKIANTILSADYWHEEDIVVRFPSLISIANFFSTYEKTLCCKYTTCLGSGIGPYFIELNIQYMGTSLDSEGYFVND